MLALVLLIPIAQAWLGGRTHLVSCSRPVTTPFQVLVVDGTPVVTSSARLLTADPEESCGGLAVDLGVGPGPGEEQVTVTIRFTNPTPFVWRGSVDLQIGEASIPVDVGTVPSGTTVESQIPVRVGEGTTDLSGWLVVGP